jgi:hypothetical protein
VQEVPDQEQARACSHPWEVGNQDQVHLTQATFSAMPMQTHSEDREEEVNSEYHPYCMRFILFRNLTIIYLLFHI